MTGRTLARINRFAFVALSGGTMFQLGSCNDEVSAALLAGGQSTSVAIANALIAALFEGLVP